MELMEIGTTYKCKRTCCGWRGCNFLQPNGVKYDVLYKNDLMLVTKIVTENNPDITTNIIQVLTQYGVRYIHDKYDVKKI